jgi:hypothetical protein
VTRQSRHHALSHFSFTRQRRAVTEHLSQARLSTSELINAALDVLFAHVDNQRPILIPADMDALVESELDVIKTAINQIVSRRLGRRRGRRRTTATGYYEDRDLFRAMAALTAGGMGMREAAAHAISEQLEKRRNWQQRWSQHHPGHRLPLPPLPSVAALVSRWRNRPGARR